MKIEKTFEFTEVKIYDRKKLGPYLAEIWQQRFGKLVEDDEPNEDNFNQSFLTFDGNNAKARNYIGVIQTEEEQIEIYPKVFKGFQTNDTNVTLFNKHLFFWFDYCRKWKFPVAKNHLDLQEQYDLPELIMNMMANRTKQVISESPISLYQEIEESLSMPRGRINFQRYISKGICSGNYQTIECDLEPSLYDNKLNRAIKYVTRLLEAKSKFKETRQKLNDILFILAEVEDLYCTKDDLDAIKINSFYSDYYELIDICRLVLDQKLYNNRYYEQIQWCLLFPMEYIFEDFIAGFVEIHFGKLWEVEYQKSDKYLTDERAFKMQHDIFLTNKVNKSFKIIVDTKYKLRSGKDRADKKRGISQSDLYQMTSYAFRRGCNNVLLLYPNFSEKLQDNDYFTISSCFQGNDKIHVTAAEVPFWNMSKFESLPQELYKSLDGILKSIENTFALVK